MKNTRRGPTKSVVRGLTETSLLTLLIGFGELLGFHERATRLGGATRNSPCARRWGYSFHRIAIPAGAEELGSQ